MSYYINPEIGTKEEWLWQNGKFLLRGEVAEFDFTSDSLPVCLIDNGLFTAAGIAFDARERDAFITPDGRPKVWFLVAKDKLTPWYKERVR